MTKLVSDAQQLADLDAQLPALLSGERQPASARQAADIAKVCYYKRHYAAAAQFFAAALAQESALAEVQRYDAACVAAIAAAHDEQDSAPLPDEKRTQLRGQALTWLRAEFNSWQQRSDTGKPADRIAAIRTLRHWRNDPDLTSVREEAGLTRLPEHERDAWRQLWTDVDQLSEEVARRTVEPLSRT
jgi:hypothetical protein